MSSDDKHIIDTVVLLYFLLVGEEELLCTLLGTPLQVPLAVYDPEDRDLLPMAQMALRHWRRASKRLQVPVLRQVPDRHRGQQLSHSPGSIRRSDGITAAARVRGCRLQRRVAPI